MSSQPMVCKHCGGDDFFVNVTVSGWQDLSDVTVGANGKPDYHTSGPVEVDGYDGDINTFVCNGCRAEAGRLSDLAVPKPADGERAIAPCGRCDHSRGDHGELRPVHKDHPLGYTRRAMPCEHEGCDCHDYYDREFAEAAAA